MTYDTLLTEAEADGLIVEDVEMKCHDGLICDNFIAIRKDLSTSTEKICVLAEEMGHAKLTSGNILDQSDAGNRQQELKARILAYNKLIGLRGIADAFDHGCRNRYEIAEYLGVTEKFLDGALKAYRAKYGCRVRLDNYLIRFIPHLDVVRML